MGTGKWGQIYFSHRNGDRFIFLMEMRGNGAEKINLSPLMSHGNAGKWGRENKSVPINVLEMRGNAGKWGRENKSVPINVPLIT
ncbi:MAG: hypothetical protein ACI9W6_000307 [Motiliproteus sp.]|jgi:hypothetical protein